MTYERRRPPVGIVQRGELCRALRFVGDHEAVDRSIDYGARTLPSHPSAERPPIGDFESRSGENRVRPSCHTSSFAGQGLTLPKVLHRLTVVMEKPRNKPADCSVKFLGPFKLLRQHRAQFRL